MFHKHISSPLGTLTLWSDGASLTGLWFGEKDEGEKNEDLLLFAKTENWLDRYFNGLRPEPNELPLSPEGGDFRRLIWGMLLEIPFGETVTYSELAKRAAEAMGKKTMAAQAVGGAVGHNPISIIIPCHRVVGKNGLTGYGGGLDKKEFLLRLEGAIH